MARGNRLPAASRHAVRDDRSDAQAVQTRNIAGGRRLVLEPGAAKCGPVRSGASHRGGCTPVPARQAAREPRCAVRSEEFTTVRWNDQRRSGNVEDERGSGGGFRGFGGGGSGGGFGFPMGRLGGGGFAILLVVALVTIFAGDPLHLLGDTAGAPRGAPDPAQAQTADFVSVVLADTEDVWHELFAQRGLNYTEPHLVLFTDEVQSGCGDASAETGPFYCPEDSKVYLDLSFFDELTRRFGAPGDFAEAYVIAHEVGHHVQHLLGVSEKVSTLQQHAAKGEANALSVRLELQADFYAGVWAHHAQRMHEILEPGDIDEALAAASAIGDDRLQRQEQGRVVPDSFTHGTSAQRAAWFKRGWDSGDMKDGDTFAAKDLSHP
jgi:uncharacterized protein